MKKWEEHEIQFLINNYNIKSVKQISFILDRTYAAVVRQAGKLKLSNKRNWTKEEISLLYELYPIENNKKLSKFFNRKTNEICDKAYSLKIKKLNFKKYEEKEFIRNFLELVSDKGRTPMISEIESEDWGMSSTSIFRYFGGYKSFCKALNIIPNMNIFGSVKPYYESKNKDLCWSKSEVIITDFLIDNNIEYKRELLYCEYIEDKRCNNKTCDWVLSDGTFVEYFGMVDKKYYLLKTKLKIELCNTHNINLLCIYEKDIPFLKELFKQYI